MWLLFLIFSATSTQRLFLESDRKPSWNVSNVNDGPDLGQPEQVRLALGENPSELSVTWLTFSDTVYSEVEWGPRELGLKYHSKARVSSFKPPTSNLTRFIHRAIISNVKPGVEYVYRVGSDFGVSSIFTFKGMKEREGGGFSYAFYGDMGVKNARSLGRIQKFTQAGDIDVILHVGDMAYDMHEDGGCRADAFLNHIEPISSVIPYMVSPGNHETKFNFTYYINSFTMPNTDHNLFYSYDVGPVHFISFSSEPYYDIIIVLQGTEDLVLLKNQFEWLKEDLKKANANRHNVPWIITMAHRPMYCSTHDTDDCKKLEARTRVGYNGQFGLEDLFYQSGVDIELWAHEHTYERLYPTYNRTVYNGTNVDNPYIDPPAPIHLLSGSAGCREEFDLFDDKQVWDAFRSSNYGFGMMRVFNETHIRFQQIVAATGNAEDEIWIIKNRHGSYTEEHKEELKKNGFYVDY